MSSKKGSMTIEIKVAKPRNPLHAIMASKRGGSHEPSRKAKRQADKMSVRAALSKALNKGADDFSRPLPFLA